MFAAAFAARRCVVGSSSTASMIRRTFAMGPASGGTISDEMLDKLGSLSTQALVDGLWVMGWPAAQIDAARPLAPGINVLDVPSHLTLFLLVLILHKINQPVVKVQNTKPLNSVDPRKYWSCLLQVHGNL